MTFGLISRRPALKPRSTPSASTSKARCKTPDDLDAPPLDSEDDESESQIVSKSGNAAHISDPDSSDGATSSRHDIKKTVFSKTKRGLPSRNAKVSRDRQGAGTSKRRHEDEDKTSGGTSAKRRSMSPSKDGVDEFLRNRKEDERRVTNKKGYGKESKNLPGRSLQPKGKAKAEEKFKPLENKSTSTRQPRLRALSPVPDSPKKEEVPKASLKRPGSIPSSPSVERQRASLIVPGSLAESPTKPRERKRRAKQAEKEDPESELPKSVAAMFRIPGPIAGEDIGTVSAARKTLNVPALDVGSSASIADSEETAGSHAQIPSALDTEVACPFCYQAVDADLLRTYSKGRTLSIRQQMKFCDFHKKNSAEGAWKAKGYPSIDWDHLDSRLECHQRPIRRIIEGEQSYYKSILADKLATGQERTLKQTERSLAPGYYGNRGLRLMSEYIIRYFNEMLRERAVEDPVISGRGTTVFVSTVLVPELATRLIMEDMAVGMEEARQILADSADMGDLLHEDVGDIVTEISGDAEGGSPS